MHYSNLKCYLLTVLYVTNLFISHATYADIIDHGHLNKKLFEHEEEIKYLTNKVEILESFIHKIMLHNGLEKELDEWRTDVLEKNQLVREEEYQGSSLAYSVQYNAIVGKLKSAINIQNTEQKDNALSKIQLSLEKFIQEHKNSSFTPNANFWLAETFYHRKMYSMSIKYYTIAYNLAKAKNNNAKAASSLLKLAMSFAELEKYKEACSTIHQVRQEFELSKLPTSIKTRVDEIEGKFGCRK